MSNKESINSRMPEGAPAPSEFSLLSNKAILREKQAGNIVCEPFDPRNVQSNSIDVTLDDVYYPEVDPTLSLDLALKKEARATISVAQIVTPTLFWFLLSYFDNQIVLLLACLGVCYWSFLSGSWFYLILFRGKQQQQFWFNPYSQKSVNKVWGRPKKAVPFREITSLFGDERIRTMQNLHCMVSPGELLDFSGIKPNDLVILIGPGENILARTRESIGGKNTVTTMMKSRSSFGRSFMEVCSCSGLGDINYTGKWTMELRNNSKHYTIPLVVGRRIAQIAFFKTDGLLDESKGYPQLTGKYGSNCVADMLPKMYADREILDLQAVAPPELDEEETESEEEEPEEEEEEIETEKVKSD